MMVKFAKNNKAKYTGKRPILFCDGFFEFIMAFILSIDKPRSMNSLIEKLNNIYGEEYLDRSVLKNEIEKYLDGSSLIRYSVSKENYNSSIKSLEVKDFINAYYDIEIDQMLILFDDVLENKDFDSANKISYF